MLWWRVRIPWNRWLAYGALLEDQVQAVRDRNGEGVK